MGLLFLQSAMFNVKDIWQIRNQIYDLTLKDSKDWIYKFYISAVTIFML